MFYNDVVSQNYNIYYIRILSDIIGQKIRDVILLILVSQSFTLCIIIIIIFSVRFCTKKTIYMQISVYNPCRSKVLRTIIIIVTYNIIFTSFFFFLPRRNVVRHDDNNNDNNFLATNPSRNSKVKWRKNIYSYRYT